MPSAINPFGNLGSRDWSFSFWGAVLAFCATYLTLKAAGSLLVGLPFVGLVGLFFAVLANPLAAGVGEATHHWRTQMRTYGVQRWLMCLLGPLPTYLGLYFLNGGLLQQLLGTLIASGIALGWLFVLDKLKKYSPTF